MWLTWFYHTVMPPKDADGMANRVDPDQTATSSMFSDYTVLAKTCVSENLGSLQHNHYNCLQYKQSTCWWWWWWWWRWWWWYDDDDMIWYDDDNDDDDLMMMIMMMIIWWWWWYDMIMIMMMMIWWWWWYDDDMMMMIWATSSEFVLIAYVSSEGSGEPAHLRSLVRTSAARLYRQWVKRNLQTESQIHSPSEWLGMRS